MVSRVRWKLWRSGSKSTLRKSGGDMISSLSREASIADWKMLWNDPISLISFWKPTNSDSFSSLLRRLLLSRSMASQATKVSEARSRPSELRAEVRVLMTLFDERTVDSASNPLGWRVDSFSAARSRSYLAWRSLAFKGAKPPITFLNSTRAGFLLTESAVNTASTLDMNDACSAAVGANFWKPMSFMIGLLLASWSISSCCLVRLPAK